MADKDKLKRKRGRPPKYVIEPITDSAENVARAVVATVKRAGARDRKSQTVEQTY